MTRSASSNVPATIGSVSPQVLEHVDVLRTLAGEKERDLGSRPLSEEDALRRAAPSIAPAWFSSKALRAFDRLVGQFGGVHVIDGQADGRAQVRFLRGRGSRCFAGCCTGNHGASAGPRPRLPNRRRSRGLRAAGVLALRAGCALALRSRYRERCSSVRPAAVPGRTPRARMWKLVPPNPKALTPALRGEPFGRPRAAARCSRRKAKWLKSMSGLGCRKFRLGGSTFS